MTEADARLKAKDIVRKQGYAYLLHWPATDFWLATNIKPQYAVPGMQVIEVLLVDKE